MTMYVIFKQEGDLWRGLGESEANTPEGAIKRLVKDEVLAAFNNGDQSAPQATYAAAPQKHWVTATPEAATEVSVKITVNSDREIVPRGRRAAQEPTAA